MEQLVILLLIALISIINWIIQKSKERREKRKLEKRADATGEPVAKHEPAPDATGTETAMRRLREALGLPEEAPPPVIPKRAEPKRVEAERIEPKRMEPKRGERPVPCPLLRQTGWSRHRSLSPRESQLWCTRRQCRAGRNIAGPAFSTRLPSLRYPRCRNSLLAFANFSSRKEVCATRLSFRRFWVRRRACESVRFPHEYRVRRTPRGASGKTRRNRRPRAPCPRPSCSPRTPQGSCVTVGRCHRAGASKL